MKKTIIFLVTVGLSLSLVKATVVIDLNETVFGANFNNIDNTDAGPGIKVINGITFANVNAEFDKALYNDTKIYGNNGRVYLEAATSSKKAGYIEFTVPSAGKVTIEALIGSDPPRYFALEMKDGSGNWGRVNTFTVEEKGTDASIKRWLPYTYEMQENAECTLRVINDQTGQTQIASITVEEYTGSGIDDGNYIETENLVHETFDADPWTEEAAGNYTFTTSAGTFGLINCQVNLTKSAEGDTEHKGRIRLENKTSSVEFPELSSCGTVKMWVNAGSDGKSITLEKLSGASWVVVTTFPADVAPGEVSFSVKSKEAIKLRVTTATDGAKHINELWITNYVKDTESSIASIANGKGEISSIRYFTLTGVEVAEPGTGLYIQQNVYDNGAVETVKIMKTN